MSRIAGEARAFVEDRSEIERAARRLAATRLSCGIDLDRAMEQSAAARAHTVRRLRRFVERERLRGAAGRADYNLDRHIALSESLARLILNAA